MDRASGEITTEFPDNFKETYWDINGFKIYPTKTFLMFMYRARLKPDEIIAALQRVYGIVKETGWLTEKSLSVILEADDTQAKKFLNQTGLEDNSTALQQSFNPVNIEGVEFNTYVCLYPKRIEKQKKDIIKQELPFNTFILATITHEFSHAFGTHSRSSGQITNEERDILENLTDAVSFQVIYNDGKTKPKSLFWAFNYLYFESKKRGLGHFNQDYDNLSKLILSENKK